MRRFRAKNYDLRLVLGVTLAVAVVFMVFDGSREFGTNLFTEITGVAITVFVINRILERKERQKRISIDQRILREVQSIIASYFSIWKHLAWKFLPEARIDNESAWANCYADVVRRATVTEQFDVVSIHHPESWKLFFHNRNVKDCFKNYYEVLNEEIRQFINDFKIYLDPELLDELLNILESEYFRNIYMMGLEGTERILAELEQDTTKLESYISPDDTSHLRHFGNLMRYSAGLKKTISKFTDAETDLYQVDRYFLHPEKFV